jgi:ribosome-associated protein
MVEGRWHIKNSQLISESQKEILLIKLHNKITADGFLLVKSQTARTQLGNKEIVIEKIHKLVNAALAPKKLRIATKPSKASKEKRIENKKRKADIKTNRRKLRNKDF